MKPFSLFFFFNDTATTEIYTLSLHDALPILIRSRAVQGLEPQLTRIADDKSSPDASRVAALAALAPGLSGGQYAFLIDRKSTRLNSSHGYISYAVFCLKKKKS